MSVIETEGTTSSIARAQQPERKTRSDAAAIALVLSAVVVGGLIVAASIVIPRAISTNSESVDPAPTAAAIVPASVPEQATPTDPCSAFGMTSPPVQPDLTAPVAAMRQAVLDAALSCDYQALASLMAEDFLASSGGGDPITLWQSQEANGVRPIARLVQSLSMPFGTITVDDGPKSAFGEETFIVWPSAATYGSWADVPAVERAMLLAIYSPEEIKSFEEVGGFGGYRLGIDDLGNFRYFIAGA